MCFLCEDFEDEIMNTDGKVLFLRIHIMNNVFLQSGAHIPLLFCVFSSIINPA